MKVKAWKEAVTIPTYGIGKPEKNPVFLEKRVYQGSSGAVYPHPVIEKIFDDKINKEWNAIFLENEIPEDYDLARVRRQGSGGLDKTNNTTLFITTGSSNRHWWDWPVLD